MGSSFLIRSDERNPAVDARVSVKLNSPRSQYRIRSKQHSLGDRQSLASTEYSLLFDFTFNDNLHFNEK